MTGLVVIDAGSVIELLLNGEEGLDVRDAIAGKSLAAPATIDLDVVSALHRMQSAGTCVVDLVARLEFYLRMPLKRHDVTNVMLDAWSLRVEFPLPEAVYVALAEQLGVPLVTRNRAMAAACTRAIVVETPVGWKELWRNA